MLTGTRVSQVGSGFGGKGPSPKALAAEPDLDIDTYIARKSDVIQKVLAASDLTDAERGQILSLNDPSR